jgi:hypothetical protein
MTFRKNLTPKAPLSTKAQAVEKKENDALKASIPAYIKAKLEKLKPSSDVYNKYIVEHADRLEPGTWISIKLGETPVEYENYQEAAADNERLDDWFCTEYRGLNPKPYNCPNLFNPLKRKNSNSALESPNSSTKKEKSNVDTSEDKVTIKLGR